LWGRCLCFRFVLLAGGGLSLAAAPPSPASVTTAARVDGVAATTATKLGLILAPWGAEKEILPALSVWPRPVACVGGVSGCGGGCWVCVWCCRQAVALLWPPRRHLPPQ